VYIPISRYFSGFTFSLAFLICSPVTLCFYISSPSSTDLPDCTYSLMASIMPLHLPAFTAPGCPSQSASSVLVVCWLVPAFCGDPYVYANQYPDLYGKRGYMGPQRRIKHVTKALQKVTKQYQTPSLYQNLRHVHLLPPSKFRIRIFKSLIKSYSKPHRHKRT
jgi:hypothetical protein